MDDQARSDLLGKLAEAKTRQADVALRLKTLGEHIDALRADLGNPYFYGGRPARDPESEARFTGYKSHEPALRLFREFQDVSREVAGLKSELRDAGGETD